MLKKPNSHQTLFAGTRLALLLSFILTNLFGVPHLINCVGVPHLTNWVGAHHLTNCVGVDQVTNLAIGQQMAVGRQKVHFVH